MIIQGHFINYDNEFFGQVKINNKGLIEKFGQNLGIPDLKYNNDILIFPGFIDVHMHCREDTTQMQNHKEDFLSASEAAINGGLVHIFDMPNNSTPPIDNTSFLAKKNLTKKSKIPVTLYAGIGPKTKPLDFNVPYKVFMGPSVGDLFFSTNNDLENSISKYAEKNISFHCEDAVILEQNKNQVNHLKKRPQEAEIKAIEFALKLIKKYKLKGKICHVSTNRGMELIIDAKKSGINVKCEVALHHLYFNEEKINKENEKILQVNPPIKKKQNCDFLINAIKQDYVDFLVTDHAPHTIEEKQKGISGLSNIDAYSAIVCWLMNEKGLPKKMISKICSYNPGLFVNEFNKLKYGKIAENYVGSFTIIDPNKKITFTKSNIKTKCRWNCFEDIEFRGNVIKTIFK